MRSFLLNENFALLPGWVERGGAGGEAGGGLGLGTVWSANFVAAARTKMETLWFIGRTRAEFLIVPRVMKKKDEKRWQTQKIGRVGMGPRLGEDCFEGPSARNPVRIKLNQQGFSQGASFPVQRHMQMGILHTINAEWMRRDGSIYASCQDIWKHCNSSVRELAPNPARSHNSARLPRKSISRPLSWRSRMHAQGN